jgi:hypothetical protein
MTSLTCSVLLIGRCESMSFTVALVALVGVLGGLNLLLTVGVIRRLREHTDLLGNRPRGAAGGPKVMLAAGERAAPFDAVTLDGEPVDENSLSGHPVLVGAFAQGCTSCEERRPDFVAYARSFPGGRDRVLAVLVGEADELTEMRAMLGPVARLVTEERPGGPVTSALGVKGYPAFAVFEPDGSVRTSGTVVEDLGPAPVLARI